MRLLLELRLLLLLIACTFAGRPMTECPGEVLDRPCPAEGGRPRKVVVKFDEVGEVVFRELLLHDRTLDAGTEGRSTGIRGGRITLSSITLHASAGLPGHNVPEPIRLIVGAVVDGGSLPLSTSGRHFHRPLLA